MEELQTWITNPLEDVFRTTRKPNCGWGSRIEEHILCIAQNARESIQLAVYAGETPAQDCYLEIIPGEDCKDNGVSFDYGGIRLLHTHGQSLNIQEKVKRCELPGELPECIDPAPMTVMNNQSGGFFITAQTAKNAVPGVYEYTARLHYGLGRKKKPHIHDHKFKVEVFNVSIPDAAASDYHHELWVNFCGGSMPQDAEYPYSDNFESNARVFGIKTFSEEWFRLIENYARVLKNERMNVVTIPYYALLYRNVKIGENGEYEFDFTVFDRVINIFREYGDVKYFCGLHLMEKAATMLGMEPGEYDFPLVTAVFDPKTDNIDDFRWVYMNDERAWTHIKNLLSAVYDHVKRLGLENQWLQHVSDEVEGDEAFDAVHKCYELVHEIAPEFKTIDATWPSSLEHYGDVLDIHVPALYVHDENSEKYAEALQKKKIDVWTYTSLQPQFTYMSRLDDWKLIATRLLHWYNFKYDLNGYLCWSWNWWFYGDPWEDSCCGGWPLDGWVVFPDVKNLSVTESVRIRECTSGIYDIELLKICDKIDSKRTRMLVDLLIDRANNFTVDSDVFFRVRRVLLEMASEKE